MRRLFMLFGTIAMIVGLMILTGCTQRDSELVGSWTSEDNSQWVSTFNADGSGSHTISWGFGTTFTWSTSRNNIYWNYPGHDRLYTVYSISGDVLTITMADGVIFRYIRNP